MRSGLDRSILKLRERAESAVDGLGLTAAYRSWSQFGNRPAIQPDLISPILEIPGGWPESANERLRFVRLAYKSDALWQAMCPKCHVDFMDEIGFPTPAASIGAFRYAGHVLTLTKNSKSTIITMNITRRLISTTKFVKYHFAMRI